MVYVLAAVILLPLLLFEGGFMMLFEVAFVVHSADSKVRFLKWASLLSLVICGVCIAVVVFVKNDLVNEVSIVLAIVLFLGYFTCGTSCLAEYKKANEKQPFNERPEKDSTHS
jgi:hypothetical protein